MICINIFLCFIFTNLDLILFYTCKHYENWMKSCIYFFYLLLILLYVLTHIMLIIKKNHFTFNIFDKTFFIYRSRIQWFVEKLFLCFIHMTFVYDTHKISLYSLHISLLLLLLWVGRIEVNYSVKTVNKWYIYLFYLLLLLHGLSHIMFILHRTFSNLYN